MEEGGIPFGGPGGMEKLGSGGPPPENFIKSTLKRVFASLKVIIEWFLIFGRNEDFLIIMSMLHSTKILVNPL